MGQGNQIRAEYDAPADTDRGNLGVGDFDLPERAYDTDMVNDTFRLRNTRVIGKKLFSELKFEFTSSNSATLPALDRAHRPRQRRLHRRRRRPVG